MQKIGKWKFNSDAGAIFAIGLIVVVVYSASLSNGFINFDDNNLVTKNLLIRSLSFENLKTIFSNTHHDGYIPLTITSFALEYHFFALNPFFYHLDNLILHCGIVGLIFLFARLSSLSILAASLAALIFGIHPMHVESVDWIAQRKDLLYSFLYMSALCCYVYYITSKKSGYYCLCIVFGFLSILAKPMALSLPIILFVCDWLYKRRVSLKLFIEKIPFFVYTLAISWQTFALIKRPPNSNGIEAALIWIYTFSFYWIKFFFSWTFVPQYHMPKPITILNGPYLISICVLVMIMTAIIRWRRNRLWIFAVAFYFGSIFFLLRFDEGHFRHIIADRYMYLPSVGICLFLGYIISFGLAKLQKHSMLYQKIGYRGGSNNEEELLQSCYNRSMVLAAENNITTIAFPCISTGIYRFPKELASKIAVDTVKQCLMTMSNFEKVLFVCFNDQDGEYYQKLL